jgi:hypothetical protein
MAMVIEVKHTAVKNTLYTAAKQVHTYTFKSLPLQLGDQFGPVTLAYETWGTLNEAGDNAVLITHALTGDTHAIDANQDAMGQGDHGFLVSHAFTQALVGGSQVRPLATGSGASRFHEGLTQPSVPFACFRTQPFARYSPWPQGTGPVLAT